MASLLRIVKKIIIGPIDWFLYTVLTEEQKRSIASLFSERQKDFIRKFTSMGKIHAQRQQINQLKYYLYNLGLEERALTTLKELLVETTSAPFQRALAWELALWYANQWTEEGAEKAFTYLQQAEVNEKNSEQLRKIAIMKAECLQRSGDRERGMQIIQEQLAKEVHPDVLLAAANCEPSLTKRMDWINKAYAHYDLQPISLDASLTKATYDDLCMAGTTQQITSGPKVSVILPAFNAEDGIHTAIESILAQTWQNFELLIIDDCSTDCTVEVVQKYVQKDARIKLFSTPVNSGPYIARNIGLREATGEYVTVNDADDWSHAEKLEKQVVHLIDHPAIIANTSEHARLTADFTLYRRGTPGIYIFPNMSSLMFRREPVLQYVGYWDEVRFAGDGEFKRRLLRVFGEQNFVDVKTGPLSLPRQSAQSLTGSSAFGYNGYFIGARREYVEAIEHHHETSEQLRYPFHPEKRPFPVPEPMKPQRRSPKENRPFDLVIAADFRMILSHYPTFLEEIAQVGEQRIGFVQMGVFSEEWDETPQAEVRDIIDGESVQMLVYGEKIKAKTFLILDQLVLADWQRYIPEIDAEQIFVRIREGEGEMLINQEKMLKHIQQYFSQIGLWIPANERVAQQVQQLENIPVQAYEWEDLMRYV